jgi:hypothetical protein
MYAARTTYHLANTPADYKALHAFFKAEAAHPQAKAEGWPEYKPFTVSFPTVYARRDGQTVGVLASQFHPRYGLVASPFHVSYTIKNHVPTVIRLVDTYEAILREAGVPGYLILVPSFKPSGKRIFADLKQGDLVGSLPHLRMDLYHVKTGI